jgi:hypothetical protein
LSEPHGAATLPGLGLSEHVAVALAGECPAYPDDVAVEVNVVPLEAEKLALPHAGLDGDLVSAYFCSLAYT